MSQWQGHLLSCFGRLKTKYSPHPCDTPYSILLNISYSSIWQNIQYSCSKECCTFCGWADLSLLVISFSPERVFSPFPAANVSLDTLLQGKMGGGGELISVFHSVEKVWRQKFERSWPLAGSLDFPSASFSVPEKCENNKIGKDHHHSSFTMSISKEK